VVRAFGEFLFRLALETLGQASRAFRRNVYVCNQADTVSAPATDGEQKWTE
jgi:hypothetical protein